MHLSFYPHDVVSFLVYIWCNNIAFNNIYMCFCGCDCVLHHILFLLIIFSTSVYWLYKNRFAIDYYNEFCRLVVYCPIKERSFSVFFFCLLAECIPVWRPNKRSNQMKFINFFSFIQFLFGMRLNFWFIWLNPTFETEGKKIVRRLKFWGNRGISILLDLRFFL